MDASQVGEFRAIFNRIDKRIKHELGYDQHVDFGTALRDWTKKRPGWRFTHSLKLLANVRNVLVHDEINAGKLYAEPSAEAVQLLRQILDDLERPPRVIPAYQRPVQSVTTDDTLARVLTIVHGADYSQFPVYEGEVFKGLLTENGIVRHLSKRGADRDTLVEFEEIKVSTLLREDQNRRNYEFVGRDTRVDDAIARFTEKPVLEALLITASGKPAEKLLGIITQWNALEFHKGKT